MSIVVLGVNYHTSPVTLLEKVMIPVPAMSRIACSVEPQ